MDPLRDPDPPVPAAGGHPPARPGAVPLAVEEYLRLYGAGRYFDAHETLEMVWRRRPDDPVMVLLHGLIQWAVAFEHHRRGNPVGAVSLLGKAWGKLADRDAEDAVGIDLTALRAEHAAIDAAFRTWRDGADRPAVTAPAITRRAPARG